LTAIRLQKKGPPFKVDPLPHARRYNLDRLTDKNSVTTLSLKDLPLDYTTISRIHVPKTDELVATSDLNRMTLALISSLNKKRNESTFVIFEYFF
jgi:hypothetical protein